MNPRALVRAGNVSVTTRQVFAPTKSPGARRGYDLNGPVQVMANGTIPCRKRAFRGLGKPTPHELCMGGCALPRVKLGVWNGVARWEGR